MLGHHCVGSAIFSIILLVYALALTAKRIEMETISCLHNATTFLSDVKCFLHRDHNNITKVSMFINLIKTLDSFDVRYTLELSRKNAARIKVLDIKVNACTFLESAQKQKFLGIFKKQLESVLNVVPQCPFKAPFNYTFTDYYMDVNLLPRNFPPADYRALFLIYYHNRLMLTIKSTGKIID